MRIFAGCLLFAIFACVSFAAAQQPAQEQPDHQQRGGREFRGITGQITEISGSTLKIKQPSGDIATVTVNSDTRFRKGREEAKLRDLKVGDSVIVRGESTGANAWTASMVGSAPSQAQMQEMQQRMKEAMGKTIVVGDVKAIDPPKLTIQRTDGVEQTIEADENTSFRKGRGESITLPDIKAGDTIFARGELKNGVFVPANINLLDPEMARRMKEGRGGMIFGFLGSGNARQYSQQPDSNQPQSSPQQVPKQ
jgi:hypothetical protein